MHRVHKAPKELLVHKVVLQVHKVPKELREVKDSKGKIMQPLAHKELRVKQVGLQALKEHPMQQQEPKGLHLEQDLREPREHKVLKV